jgi:hypothetical protein
MMNFVKTTQVNMAQIRRNLDKKYHPLLLILITDIELKSGNMTTVSMTDVRIWHGSKSRKIFGTFRKKLEQVGFWVKIKTDEYMVNPSVMNTTNSQGLSSLYKLFLARGGVRINLDDHLKQRKETMVVQEFESALAKELKSAINAAHVKGFSERDETVERLENKIDSLQKDMKFLIGMMTNEQKKKVERHLKLVKDDRD